MNWEVDKILARVKVEHREITDEELVLAWRSLDRKVAVLEGMNDSLLSVVKPRVAELQAKLRG